MSKHTSSKPRPIKKTPENSPPKAIQQANIVWDDNGQPISTAFDDVYFNSDSSIDESRYVFMEQNQLPERWSNHPGHSFTIGETGFGTGLNFLVTAKAWLEHTSAETNPGILHFVSVEKSPLSKEDLQRTLKLWPELFELADELIQLYPPAVPGIHRLKLANNRIILTLMYGEADDMFAALKGSDHPLFQQQGNPVINAWFLDGFAPSKNPEMWSETLFQTIADLSELGTTFSTFTVARAVRHALEHTGFQFDRSPGFGLKREILHGSLIKHTTSSSALDNQQTPRRDSSPITAEPATFNSPYQPPWYLPSTIEPTPETAIVIGGGIAGCATARALAERGITVTLIERHRTMGQEGSGSPQGILYPKLSTSASQLTRFGLAALLNASRYHNDFLDLKLDSKNLDSKKPGTEAVIGNRCGVLVLPSSENDKEKFKKMAEQFPKELVQLLEGEQLNQTVGLSLTNQFGLFFPKLGWIKPPIACQILTEHPLITIQTSEVANIDYEPGSLSQHGCWQALNNTGNTIATAQVMVIACGFDSSNFNQTSHLPVKKVRGQISRLPTTKQSSALKTVLCGEGYIAPAEGGEHTLGATYNIGETSTAVRPEDHQINMQQLATTDAAMADTFGQVDVSQLQGRAAFRCTTPDYLPIAGPAPKLESYLNDYKLLRKNARSHIPIAGATWPGLYINIGHGSRGLSYAPLCAELIASQICGEVPPLELDLRQAVHPGRFIIRDLKRNKR
ncbi:MAG TPA: bifunctional tRNA (5-methylaminomethyl-2-thiouridine)(34)-methyltransferase MnmD/FAD-dependent 5-carboxymethylaminomethyl-2-thiouridine(34) oxidoreductase MnmC [Porticoccus sp.]|nr:bifunctional tRNA (5-methylaminomethyl-2-thiouridine)(34)-methyltransferase MnmD/FAD-dependent 5-carboxymethylaminomethyl-2-thiouridine(34) oxidoreductase MnmC [Porticoccus sp.]